MKNTIYRQFDLESEGASAAIAGKTRDECPYSRDTHSFEWNHWVFGYDIATSEQAIVKNGFVTFYSTAEDGWEYPTNVQIDRAIDSGMWKPKYISLTKRSS